MVLWMSEREQYSTEECFEKGKAYYNGDGVEQSYGEAAKWLRLSADQGDARAQCILGMMYKRGEGVEQSYGEATRWFRLAADQGHSDAEYNLKNILLLKVLKDRSNSKD